MRTKGLEVLLLIKIRLAIYDFNAHLINILLKYYIFVIIRDFLLVLFELQDED